MLSRSSRHLLRSAAVAVPALVSCAPHHGSRSAANVPKAALHASYEVNAHADATLDISLKVSPGTQGTFMVDDGMDGFVSALRVDDAPLAKPHWEGSALELDGAVGERCAKNGCTIRYRFDLAKAAEVSDEAGAARLVDGTYVTCPSAWILRPAHSSDDSTFELAVHVDAPMDFAFGTPSDTGSPRAFHGLLADLDEPPYAALGTFRRLPVDDAGALEVVVTGPAPDIGDQGIASWISEAVKNLRTIYAGYPSHHTLLIVQVAPGSRVGPGTTMGNGGAAIEVRLGAAATPAETGDDWILTHEMLHTTFPGLARMHHWAEEGMATYLEPIARARRGVIPVERVWQEWHDSMHLGEPFEDDQGLDQTASWGRTYWGGAMFWFVSDVEIRKATANAHGAPDFFADIYRKGDIAVRWPMSKVVEVADASSRSDVLSKLYAVHATHPVKVDLDGMFSDLGVRTRDGKVVLDDSAPLAAIRKAIVTGPLKP